ncbi:MAG: hypothetical protein LC635_00030 [Pseudonocardiaceae bacterium]|nr:hypothetical protein [Pseudonocardiaceae bacterium]
MSDDEKAPDIKDLLGRALGGQEPPLGIDRDKVFQEGRKRLHRRRVFQASGVVASVMAAAVGASILTGLVGELNEQPTPPAANDTGRPPVSTTTPATTPTAPTTSADPPSAATTTPGDTLPEQHATTLTDALYKSAFAASDEVMSPPGLPGEPRFRVVDGRYLFEADVKRGDGEGAVQVSVEAASSGETMDCATLPQPFANCQIISRQGMSVAVASWRGDGGEKQRLALTIRPDGSRVAAIATNLSTRQRQAGKAPTRPTPDFSEEELVTMVLLPGLHMP